MTAATPSSLWMTASEWLCQLRRLPRLSTAQLIAEMVAFEAVGEDEGFRAFDRATPTGVGRTEFDRAVQRCRFKNFLSRSVGPTRSTTPHPFVARSRLELAEHNEPLENVSPARLEPSTFAVHR